MEKGKDKFARLSLDMNYVINQEADNSVDEDSEVEGQ